MPVVDYEGLYEISDRGRVLSLARLDRLGRRVRERIMAAPPDGHGYPRVKPSKDGTTHDHFVHHLVLTSHVGPRPQGQEACHFPDPTRSNVALENLRWDTRAENHRDRRRYGRCGNAAKLNEASVADIRALVESGRSPGAVARNYGVTYHTVWSIVRRRTWASNPIQREEAR